MPLPPPHIHHALIKTHHITSRRKIALLRAAATTHACRALLRSGGAPVIMYVEGGEEAVGKWVRAVKELRYKDFRVLARPGVRVVEGVVEEEKEGERGVLEEVGSVGEFGARMEGKGVWEWWRGKMGFKLGGD